MTPWLLCACCCFCSPGGLWCSWLVYSSLAVLLQHGLFIGVAGVDVEDGVEGGADTFMAALKEVLGTVLPHAGLLPQLLRKAAMSEAEWCPNTWRDSGAFKLTQTLCPSGLPLRLLMHAQARKPLHVHKRRQVHHRQGPFPPTPHGRQLEVDICHEAWVPKTPHAAHPLRLTGQLLSPRIGSWSLPRLC